MIKKTFQTLNPSGGLSSKFQDSRFKFQNPSPLTSNPSTGRVPSTQNPAGSSRSSKFKVQEVQVPSTLNPSGGLSSRFQDSRFKFQNPSTLNSHPSTFSFGPSVQVDLFNYLKPAQHKAIRPFLQIIKRPYQEKLCISLMDYLEGNGLNPISQPILRYLQQQIIEVCDLHPLTSSRAAGSKFQVSGFRSVSEPKCIGTLIKQLFPSLSHLKHETGKAL